MSTELDPYKTILVVKHEGREVGRIPATAPNAEDYLTGLVRHYGQIDVDYVPDGTGGLALLFSRKEQDAESQSERFNGRDERDHHEVS